MVLVISFVLMFGIFGDSVFVSLWLGHGIASGSVVSQTSGLANSAIETNVDIVSSDLDDSVESVDNNIMPADETWYGFLWLDANGGTFSNGGGQDWGENENWVYVENGNNIFKATPNKMDYKPMRDGYSFDGFWSYTVDYNIVDNMPSTVGDDWDGDQYVDFNMEEVKIWDYNFKSDKLEDAHRIFAKWREIDTITFDLNPGYLADNVLNLDDITGGTPYVVATATKSMPTDLNGSPLIPPAVVGKNIEFDGFWTSAKDGTLVYDKDMRPIDPIWTADRTKYEVSGIFNPGYPLYTNFVIYAHWKIGSVTIKLNPNGGELGGEYSSISGIFVIGKNLPDIPKAQMPTLVGHKFLGYFSDIVDGDMYFDEDLHGQVWNKEGKDFTLYAHWELKTYYVTLNLDGGQYGTLLLSVEYGTNLADAPELDFITKVPAKTDYIFRGFYDSKDGFDINHPSGTQYFDENMHSDYVYEMDNNLTLYASWLGKKYTVSLDLGEDAKWNNDGTVLPFGVTIGELPSANILVYPVKTGYDFVGFFAEGDDKPYYQLDSNSSVILKSVREWDIFENTTLYAHWEAKLVKVIISIKNGSNTKEISIKFGDRLPVDIDIPKNGDMKFGGIYDKPNGAGTMYLNSDGTPTDAILQKESIVLYVYWIPPYVVPTGEENGLSVETMMKYGIVGVGGLCLLVVLVVMISNKGKRKAMRAGGGNINYNYANTNRSKKSKKSNQRYNPNDNYSLNNYNTKTKVSKQSKPKKSNNSSYDRQKDQRNRRGK